MCASLHRATQSCIFNAVEVAAWRESGGGGGDVKAEREGRTGHKTAAASCCCGYYVGQEEELRQGHLRIGFRLQFWTKFYF